MQRTAQLSFLIIVLVQSRWTWANPQFAYIRSLKAVDSSNAVVVDTRTKNRCMRRTVAGARCLPATALLGPNGRLPAFRQLVWVLGTLGLSGHGTVVVAGDNPLRRDFVAGVLYLLGQQRVLVLAPRLKELLSGHNVTVSPGVGRGVLAEPPFQGQARSGLIVFRGELLRALRRGRPLTLLDGRSAARYWGNVVTALRGGHIPGAISLDIGAVRAKIQAGTARIRIPPGAIAYAQGPLSSIAYFTALTAGLGVDVRVFPWGWVDWADHTSMPVAIETLPASRGAARPYVRERAPSTILAVIIGVISVASLLLSVAALGIAMRRKQWI